MKKILSLARAITPKSARRYYHALLPLIGALRYGFPSRKLIVIGIVGTRGKTTTANYLWSILTANGITTGLTSTALFRCGTTTTLNPYHMTMPGRFVIQKKLAEMVQAGCTVAIIETPSEGIEQSRTNCIAYDMLVFTRYYPERLAIHDWSPERICDLNAQLFTRLPRTHRKKFKGTAIQKIAVLNRDDAEYDRLACAGADRTVTYGTHVDATMRAEEVAETQNGITCVLDGVPVTLRLAGLFNVGNALAAVAAGRALHVTDAAIKKGIEDLYVVPGRMEAIERGQEFRVLVDYAHDGPSIEALLDAAQTMRNPNGGRILILVGAEGGGRDKEKRPVMGRACARRADITIVTNIDPYDDDAQEILDDVARGAEEAGATRGDTLFVIEDRREAIRHAFTLAHPGDLVLVTGKGAEQTMVLGKTTIPWDDRTVVREELARMRHIV